MADRAYVYRRTESLLVHEQRMFNHLPTKSTRGPTVLPIFRRVDALRWSLRKRYIGKTIAIRTTVEHFSRPPCHHESSDRTVMPGFRKPATLSPGPRAHLSAPPESPIFPPPPPTTGPRSFATLTVPIYIFLLVPVKLGERILSVLLLFRAPLNQPNPDTSRPSGPRAALELHSHHLSAIYSISNASCRTIVRSFQTIGISSESGHPWGRICPIQRGMC